MERITFLLLGKSIKNGGKCVGGFDCKTGKWVRLITNDQQSHGAVADKYLVYEDGRPCQLLDIMQVPILGAANDELQPENLLLDTSRTLRFIKRVTLEDALKIHPAETKNDILGNKYSYITEKRVGQIGYSLIIVKVNDLLIKHVKNNEGKDKTKADFIYRSSKYENVSVTDPNFYRVPNETKYKEAYLVVSIGAPYGERYYKFIAAIYV